MDTFFEQIVPVKKSGMGILAIIGIWILALILALAAILFLSSLFVFALAIAGFAFYGAFKLSQRFFVEYEYIVTNNSFDIDKIVARSSRKRVLSIEIPNITSIEKYNPNAATPHGCENLLVACNSDDSNAYIVIAQTDKNGKKAFVFSPNERVIEGMCKTLPRYIANSAFKK